MLDEVGIIGSSSKLVDSRTKSLRNSQSRLEDTSAQLRASYEAARDGIIVVGVDGNIITANQRIMEFFHMDDDWALANVSNFADNVRSKFINPNQFVSEWTSINNDNSLVHLDGDNGSIRKNNLHLPVLLPNGNQIARFWSFHDVTEERRLQKGLEQAQKMEAVGRLAGGVAHDFNNLLTGIIGNLSLVKSFDDRGSHEANKEFILSAKKASHRAAELVKQLLGFSRQSHLELDYCQVNEVIDEVKSLLKSTIDPKVSISTDLLDNLWTVEADSTQVEQVIMNLCVNAIDAMNGSGGELKLVTENVTITQNNRHEFSHYEKGEYVKICVVDNGSGMSQEIKAKLFEPFSQPRNKGKGPV